jgi:hypothetical protein
LHSILILRSNYKKQINFSIPLCTATATANVTATEAPIECHAAATTAIKTNNFCILSFDLKTLTFTKKLHIDFAKLQAPLLSHLQQPLLPL